MSTAKRRADELTSVSDFLREEYTIENEIDSGGTGIVFRGHKTADPDTVVAIKFYVVPAQSSFLMETTFRALILPEDEEVFSTEFTFLKRTRHPGVQELISYGVLEDAGRYFGSRKEIFLPENGRVRFLISRFIDGSRLSDWMAATIRDVRTGASKLPARDARRHVCRVLFEIADTLSYIHDVRRYQHSDLRSDNVLVHQASGRPIVIDFGYAHCFDAALKKPYTQIRYIADNMPPSLREDVKKLVAKSRGNRVPREELRDLVFPGLDLHNFGVILNELIAADGIDNVLTSFDRQFVHLIARRLTTWRTAREANASEVAAQLKKLETGLRAPAHSSSPDVDQHVALPTGGLNLTSTMERLLATQAFRRLQLLNQLSLVNLIYPGASQSRFEHSLAVYVTASELVDSLSRSPRFRLLFDEHGVNRLLIAALLHDINHFSFLHYFQEISEPTLKQVDTLDLFCNGEATKDKPSIYSILADEGITPGYLKQLLFDDHDTLADGQMQVIKSIIDSGVDVDKLTYVRDDARFTGVPFGFGIDRAALFERADIVQLKEDDGPQKRYSYHLCFRPAAQSAVESLLMARFWNFRQIYWHRTNRAIGAMITHVIAKTFGEEPDEFRAFIESTIGRTDTGTLDLLDERFRTKHKRASVVGALGSRRGRVFKRLLSIKAGWDDKDQGSAEAKKLFTGLAKLTPAARSDFLRHLRTGLSEMFKKELKQRELTDDDVLLDVPGRSLDEQVGAVHICDLTPDGRPSLQVRSPFVDQLVTQFGVLSRTVRIFIAPEIRNLLGKDHVASMREAIYGIVKEAYKKAKGAVDMYK
jgi:uncharacterized protein